MPAEMAVTLDNNNCRTCLNKISSEKHSLLDEVEASTSIAFILSSCTNLQVYPNDGLPLTICNNCYNCVKNFYYFKKQAECIDKQLHSYLNNCNITTKDEYLDHNTLENEDEPDYNSHDIYADNLHLADLSSETKENELCIPEIETKEQISKTFQCNVCSLYFKSINALAAHKRKHVSKHRVLACSQCGKRFKKISHLKRHEMCHEGDINRRNGVKPFKCKICSKEFSHQTSKDYHEKFHQKEKHILCSICGRLYNKTNLRQHLRRHIGIKSLSCNYCPMKFVSKGELQTHATTHINTRTYKCTLCDSTFTNRTALSKHKNTHKNEKIFKCDSCDIILANKQGLKSHARVHSGEKPYQCELCKRMFAHSSTLLKHRRVHLGVNLYKCDECGESFRLKMTLRRHMSIHYVNKLNNTQTEPQIVTINID